MKRKLLLLFFILLFSIILVGCGAEAGGVVPELGEGSSSNDGIVIETNRKIYYTVRLYVDTKDVNGSVKIYNQKALEFDGYISSSNIKSSGTSSVVYRVPTDKLEDFLDYIDGHKTATVKEKYISSEDITSKYNQTQSRLDVLYASREAYLKMLEKESNLGNIISIQNKIEDINSELLRLEYEKASYDSLLEYSTITVYFNSTAIERSFMGDYLEYFVGVFKVIGIIILYSIPFGLIALIIVTSILLPKYIKKKRGLKEEDEEIQDI